MNNLKTVALLAALSALLILVGGALGGRGGMTIALVLAVGLNFFSYWFSDTIVLKMYRAIEVSEAEAPDLHRMVRELTTRAQMPMPKIYIIESPQPNAFATGRNPEHAAVAATTGIMNILSYDELRGVMAHELAHVRNRDILISTVAATIAAALTWVANMAQWTMIFGGMRGDDEERGNPIAAILMMIIAPIAAMLIQMAISRSREYQADATGALISGTPRSLANALRKLHYAATRIPMEEANPATSHMFIVNPLSAGAVARMFSTHPPMEDRIARLESMTL